MGYGARSEQELEQVQRINQEPNENLQLHPNKVHELEGHHKLTENQRQDL